MNRECKISAEIIADSKNVITGDRITSFVIVIPRIVLAEFNTHRMISRNSASSRAIPFAKMLERVKNEPFMPLKYQKDHSGMQGTEYFGEEHTKMLDSVWLAGRDRAVESAQNLAYGIGINEAGKETTNIGVTKQLVNRMLETYMYHTIICTATEWANFMALRAHPAAEIHIAKCAELMLEAMNSSTPKDLQPGEWHIPFGDNMDEDKISEIVRYAKAARDEDFSYEDVAIKIATARCARVSYMNYEGGDDYDKDIKLHDRLSSMGHWSPFEHCAQAMNLETVKFKSDRRLERVENISDTGTSHNFSIGWSGNFKGFIQYRKTFAGENKKDERLLDK